MTIKDDELSVQYEIVKWDENDQELINWHRERSIKLLGESLMKYLLNCPEGIRDVVVKERKETRKDFTTHTITVYFWRDEIK